MLNINGLHTPELESFPCATVNRSGAPPPAAGGKRLTPRDSPKAGRVRAVAADLPAGVDDSFCRC